MFASFRWVHGLNRIIRKSFAPAPPTAFEGGLRQEATPGTAVVLNLSHLVRAQSSLRGTQELISDAQLRIAGTSRDARWRS